MVESEQGEALNPVSTDFELQNTVVFREFRPPLRDRPASAVQKRSLEADFLDSLPRRLPYYAL
jgi:hypothetical protein